MPFGDGQFDCVVSSDSLHHWQDPVRAFNEIARVLKGEGTCLIHDLKRLDGWLPRLASWLMGLTIPPDLCIHYKHSLQAAYPAEELEAILERSMLQGWRIREEFIDITVVRGRNL
jgi:ubiquinone/menaquinone biosynthesis C-methylase UbiE